MNKILLLILSVYFSACIQEMGILGHLEPYAALEGKPVARPLPENTVARGQLTKKMPMQGKLSHALFMEGMERYEIYCAPCHGLAGYGNGLIVQRGFPKPSSFHEERLLAMPNEYFTTVIKNGFGKMYGFADKVSQNDIFAIAQYIRALQLSQNVHLKDLPLSFRQEIMRELK